MKLPLALGVGGIAFALLAEHLGRMWLEPVIVPLADMAIGLSLIGSGVAAMLRRPAQPAGLRLVLAGYAWFIGTLVTAEIPIIRSFGSAFLGYQEPILALLVLSFPERFPKSRFVRGVIVAGFAVVVANTLVRLAVRVVPELLGATPAPGPGPLVVAMDIVRWLWLVVPTATALVILRRAAGPRRRLLQPVLLGGAVSLLAGIVSVYFPLEFLGLVTLPEPALLGLGWGISALRVLAPLGIYVGIARLRERRTAIGQAFVDVAGSPTPGRLQAALAHALGDPTLRVFGWDREAGRHVAADGSSLAADDAVADGVAVTYLTHGDQPIAAVMHDRALLEEPGLIAALSATVKLTVQNEQLERDVERQLDEVRASRARIVEAGDRERRRIERDLHDGIQQRLVAMALRLRRTSEGVAGRDATLAQDLRALETETAAILEEARELARGIHPGVLADVGLEGAIRALASRSPVPVDVDVQLEERPPATVEATAYFVVSEALANVAKHASASRARVRAVVEDGRLVIHVDDDGVGGARLDGGSGLRGLADRLSSVNGSLVIEPASPAGTHLTAIIPCVSS